MRSTCRSGEPGMTLGGSWLLSVVTANGRKLSRSDQLCSEADEGVEFSESSIPGMLTTELKLDCGLASGRGSWVGVE